MSQTEVPEQVPTLSADGAPASPSAPAANPSSSQACAACGADGSSAQSRGNATPSYVYAIGTIEPRFPRPSAEKEFAQVAGRVDAAGLTDRQLVREVLSARANRYLARQMCWVMTIAGLDAYILVPRDPSDFEFLIDALRPAPSPMDLDCVIGVRGPVAQYELCGLAVPIVGFDQIYSFDRDSLIQAIPKPEKMTAKEFTPAAAELFDRLMQMTDNLGASDEHRAVNYLAVRYDAIYASAAAAFARNASLTSVDAWPSRLAVTRNVVDVVFTFTDRATDVIEKFLVRVDVTEEFPFLVTRLSPYYDR